MEADVSKNQLSSNLSNNTGSLHPGSGQSSVLDNHTWKPMDTQDTQDTITQVQEMLEHISSRGVQSMLVTVGPFGEIGIHGSQKGQLFLKENSDIGDRFAKMCTDLIDIAGSQRPETFDIGTDDDSNEDHLPFFDGDDSDTNNTSGNNALSKAVKDRDILTPSKIKEPVRKNKPRKVTSTSLLKKDEGYYEDDKKSTSLNEVSTKDFDSETEKYQIKVNVRSGSAIVKRVKKKQEKSPLKKKKNSGVSSGRTYKEKRKTEKNEKGNSEVDGDKETVLVQPAARSFNCRKCNAPFSTTVAHNKHLRSKICFIKNQYDETLTYVSCEQCSLKFPRLDYLEVHRVLHDDSVPRHFNAMFSDVSETLCNIENKFSETDYKCECCSLPFPEKRLLLHHVILTHSLTYQCQKCPEVCENRNKCWLHLRVHEDVKGPADSSFICHICNRILKSKPDFERHKLTCHQEGPVVSFPCDQCKKIFSSCEFLAKHKENAHAKKYRCTYHDCKKGFPTEDKLEQHMLVHGERSFMCSICGKICSSRGNFQIHMSIHNNERNFKCDVCQKTFKTKDVLTKHMRIHANTRLYCCEKCGWGFNQAGSLRKHMDSHLNIKRHECDVCNKKFSNKVSLVNHRLQSKHFVDGDKKETDSAIKAKKCEYCDKLFPPNSGYMYRRHVIIHTGDKPYSCDICSKSFSDKSNLKNHKLIHSESKPFPCKICGRGFVQKRGLRKHLESSNPCSFTSNRGVIRQSDVEESEIDASISAFHTPLPNSPTPSAPELVAVPATDEQGDQGQATLQFHASYSGDAIQTAMALSGADIQDADIHSNVMDLSSNSDPVDASWIYVKQWKE